MPFNLKLPSSDGLKTIECNNNTIVIIGANGSGKTRLGAWIENDYKQTQLVHRISAQKILNIPEVAIIQSHEQANNTFLYGFPQGQLAHKLSHRWGNNPSTAALNDYGNLLTMLFAKTVKRNTEHSNAVIEKGIFIDRPKDPAELITEVWKDIMPHREITFDDWKVLTSKEGQAKYLGKEMSDGEKVVLYLIGQCLCAPDNSIVVIDEPEIHLHKSIMYRLWNRIEELCPNKLLVYITHDLDFAASRKDAKKIWVQSYDGANTWKWEEIPEIEEIPENLLLEIIGNRKNIIFVEGEKTSYDFVLYQAVFPEHHIIPRGSCAEVIESTKAIGKNETLHHLTVHGIVDRDYRTPEEINNLKEDNIHIIDVAEIENLFCLEPILVIIAQYLGFSDSDKKLEEITNFIISELEKELGAQITSHAEREIQHRLKYSKNGHTEQDLHDALANTIKAVNISAIYSESKRLYEEALSEKSLTKILKLYNRKNLHRRIAPIFGLSDKKGKDEYINLVMRLMKGGKKDEILTALKPFLPNIIGN